MPDLLVDTDIFIDHLRGAQLIDVGDDRASYSVVTRCELFAGKSGDEMAVVQLLNAFYEHVVDRDIAVSAGRLRRDHGLRIADALIAATALAHNLTLQTRNRKHFASVTGLTLR
jgi:predicted nucleic acid-binding protein